MRRQAFAWDYHVRLVTLSPNYGPVRTIPVSPMTSRGRAAFIMRNKARKGGAIGAQGGQRRTRFAVVDGQYLTPGCAPFFVSCLSCLPILLPFPTPGAHSS